MKNYIKKIYQKIREWGWKYRQRTLHIVPETNIENLDTSSLRNVFQSKELQN